MASLTGVFFLLSTFSLFLFKIFLLVFPFYYIDFQLLFLFLLGLGVCPLTNMRKKKGGIEEKEFSIPETFYNAFFRSE